MSEAGDISFYAVGGGTMKRFQSEWSMNAMARIAREIIILCLWGNDIDATDAHALRFGMDLFQLASELKNNIHGLRRIGFCQAVERKTWMHLSVEGVRPRYRTSMSSCRQLVYGMIVFYWEHKGLTLSGFKISRPDGVHFN